LTFDLSESDLPCPLFPLSPSLSPNHLLQIFVSAQSVFLNKMGIVVLFRVRTPGSFYLDIAFRRGLTHLQDAWGMDDPVCEMS